jgi:segregation and condensation protein A
LVADCTATIEVVARFLALLELYRDGYVGFDQMDALGELHVRWSGPPDDESVLAIADRAEAEFAAAVTPAAGGGVAPDPPGAGEGSAAVELPTGVVSHVVPEGP